MSAADQSVPKAAIFGLAGLALSDAEREFFADSNPLGFILFARNCDNPDQIKALVGELRQLVGRENAPVLIDQEGGRVARLRPPHWREAPPAAVFGALCAHNEDNARAATRINAQLIGAELAALGVNVDCAPVLDVPAAGSHDIVGDRAFGTDPEMVARLGRAALDGFIAAGVIPVVKHIPGHGRAEVDSHLELPIVREELGALRESDFHPFAALADAPWAMTAHVVYTGIDPKNPATTSRIVIDSIIRGEIGFDGLLISDDLSMKALAGSFGDRAEAALTAGCDLALHCNGDLDEMRAVAEATAPMTARAIARFERGNAALPEPEAVDLSGLLTQLQTLLTDQ